MRGCGLQQQSPECDLCPHRSHCEPQTHVPGQRKSEDWRPHPLPRPLLAEGGGRRSSLQESAGHTESLEQHVGLIGRWLLSYGLQYSRLAGGVWLGCRVRRWRCGDGSAVRRGERPHPPHYCWLPELPASKREMGGWYLKFELFAVAGGGQLESNGMSAAFLPHHMEKPGHLIPTIPTILQTLEFLNLNHLKPLTTHHMHAKPDNLNSAKLS